MSDSGETLQLKRTLEKLPQVKTIGRIEIEDSIIKYIAVESEAIGRVAVHQLDASDSPAMFDFYFKGLSEKSRRLFTPYPLFNTPPNSADELAERIADWKKENDWTFINLVRDKQIIGVCLLKRFRTDKVTSGLVIRDEFHRMGLGHLLQTIIVEQARLLNLKKFHVKIVSDNIASMRLHEKCGFKQTRIVPPTEYAVPLNSPSGGANREGGDEAAERHIIEMVIELNHG